jgi:hypothetical protein
MSEEYCVGCGTEMLPIDDDPNGAKNAICARCTAEEAHDFTRFPKARFDRLGNEIERTRKAVADTRQ